jgi:hypothetical protein
MCRTSGTRKDWLFKEAVAKIVEWNALGLSTVDFTCYINWQGDMKYNHLDEDTLRSLSWIEFIDDNRVMGPRLGTHPNQPFKYDRPLTYEEIEAIEDITL